MILKKIKKDIVKQVNQALKKDMAKESDLVFPPSPKATEGKSLLDHGDISLPCFNLSKEMKKSPAEIAESLLVKIKTGKNVEAVKVAGPYLNFTINKKYLTEQVIKEINKEKNNFGSNKSGKKKRVMIEYSNANTHKEYHIGHMRNISYGDSVNRIMSANGFDLMPVSYINDFGIHVAKTLWLLSKKHTTEAERAGSKGYFLGQLYAEASKYLLDHPEAKEEVGELMKKIESRKGETFKLWKETRKWSIDQFAQIYKELKVYFKDIFYENEFIEDGMKLVSELYAKHFLIKSQGAVIADLEKFDLGVLMFLRSDGTALYPVADLPLAIMKFKKFKIHKSIYVVDVRQSLYFKQLFKVLEQLGFKQEMVHLGYDFVKLPDGMMSSRTGNIITYEDLKNKMIKKATEETYNKHENWEVKKIEEVAKKIAFGAMKFEMIKVSRDKSITFDMDKALRFDGFTAAYLQYTYARINSIIRKAGVKSYKLKVTSLEHPKEQELVMKLAKYPLAVEQAGKDYEPSEIAKYLFELCQQFNDYYHGVPVLKAPEEIMSARLALISSVKQVIANGLDLLGIDVIEEM